MSESTDKSSILALSPEALIAKFASQERTIDYLTAQLQLLQQRLYGKKSEVVDPGQLLLFASGESEAVVEQEGEAELARKKPRKAHGRKPFPEHLPRKRIDLELSEEERRCEGCGECMRDIGVEITERGEIIPAKMIVNEYARHRYACPNGHGVKIAPAAPALLERVKYEPSVYASVVTSKYADHLPLHRLEGIYKRNGFRIPKQTLWDMVYRSSELLRPVYGAMMDHVRATKYLAADETPINVSIVGRKGLKKGWLWAYRGNGRVVYVFALNREAKNPSRFLSKYRGILQGDGYVGYDEICERNGLVRAGCWAHVRRKFNEALGSSKKLAALIMIQIGRLYWIESLLDKRRIRDGLDEEKFFELTLEIRQRFSKRVVNRLYGLLEKFDQGGRVLPKSVFGKAFTYAVNQRERLETFLSEPIVEIDNNAAERDMKHIAVGRKNWLFAGSERGGEAAALLFSLVATCKAADIDPNAYLTDVLGKLDSTPASEVASLTPWAWAERQAAIA